MTSVRAVRIAFVLTVGVFAWLLLPLAAFAADDVAEMRKQLAGQRALLQAQQRQLEQQAQQLEKYGRRGRS